MTTCATCGSENDRAATVCVSCGSPINEGGYTLPVGTKLYGGKYSVGKVLGRGGFGITYGGADTQMRRPVAIKELFPEGSSRQGTTVYAPYTLNADGFSDAKRAFIDEGRLLARFNHPGIVKVYDVFEENGSAYFVMEFLRGDTLGNRLLQEGKLDPDRVTGLARALLGALERVHDQGLLHRDIKPDNIILSQDQPDSSERAVLIDFGSARQFQHGKTTQLTRLLTPDYAAPEQYQSAGRFGPYTDLYGLGATLYHALTGTKPPSATDRMVAPQPLDFPADAPRELVAALEAALALRVDQRPGTASQPSLAPRRTSPERWQQPTSTPDTDPTARHQGRGAASASGPWSASSCLSCRPCSVRGARCCGEELWGLWVALL
ncbi:MAG: serine/threonine-protein kinase [Trueperaceae bacterium]|nr:serine/threonine-protein kinase [Trueperaceae bacterium]